MSIIKIITPGKGSGTLDKVFHVTPFVLTTRENHNAQLQVPKILQQNITFLDYGNIYNDQKCKGFVGSHVPLVKI